MWDNTGKVNQVGVYQMKRIDRLWQHVDMYMHMCVTLERDPQGEGGGGGIRGGVPANIYARH